MGDEDDNPPSIDRFTRPKRNVRSLYSGSQSAGSANDSPEPEDADSECESLPTRATRARRHRRATRPAPSPDDSEDEWKAGPDDPASEEDDAMSDWSAEKESSSDQEEWTSRHVKRRPASSKTAKTGKRRRGNAGLRASDGTRRSRLAHGPDQPLLIKIPKPIPKSWAAPIMPYEEEKGLFEQKSELDEKRMYYGYMTRPLLQWDFADLPPNDYLAVLMDPPWCPLHMDDATAHQRGYITAQDFSRIAFPHQQMAAGFIFIWVEKEDIPLIFRVMGQWSFVYVENLVWVKKEANNCVSARDSPYFRRSKASLFIFRKETDVHIELKHQRNPDVLFQFLQPGGREGQEAKPPTIYSIIETLLPEAMSCPKTCRLLELWATPHQLRRGWIRVVDGDHRSCPSVHKDSS